MVIQLWSWNFASVLPQVEMAVVGVMAERSCSVSE